MNSRGALVSISRAFAKVAQQGDVVDLDAYVASAEFDRAFAALAPAARHSAMTAYSNARAECERRKPVPPAGSSRGVCKVKAWDAPLIAKFRSVWRKHKGIVPRVARELGITEGSAYRASRRFVVASTHSASSASVVGATSDGQITTA